ncbi:hypothetical protein SAMN05216323_10118 [Williamwhitmania taraxaci]|uniref:Uncharacterized protein n=1 Tax=Williamwhitmania taraxaci TaxID=1640674 RepID=A0A1G6HIH7_9BACT|nr:hypothetical protein SAMN05216323_10118 [Williamwhitmania taraxaci]
MGVLAQIKRIIVKKCLWQFILQSKIQTVDLLMKTEYKPLLYNSF